MKIVCGKCSQSYNIDESKLKKDITDLTCKVCGGTIRVTIPGGYTSKKAKASVSEMSKPAVGRPPKETDGRVRFGLLPKMVLAMLLVSIVPFGLFLGITFNETRERIHSDTELLMAQTADGLGRHVDEWIDKNVSMLNVAAQLEEVSSMIPALQQKVLKIIQTEYPFMYLVFTLDTQGMNIARSDGKKMKNYSDRQYYKEVARGKDLAWQTLIGKTSKKPALVLAVPIKRDGKTVGVLAAAMTTDAISRQIANWKKGDTGFAFLIDETGKVVAHQVPKFVASQSNFNDNPLIATYKNNPVQGLITFTDGQGVKQKGIAQRNEMGWILAVQQAEEEVFATYKRSEKIAMSLMAIILVLIIGIAFLLARSLVRPVKTLTAITTRMSMGEMDVDFHIKTKDEIGQLANAIVRLQTSLKLAIQRLREKSS